MLLLSSVNTRKVSYYGAAGKQRLDCVLVSKKGQDLGGLAHLFWQSMELSFRTGVL